MSGTHVLANGAGTLAYTSDGAGITIVTITGTSVTGTDLNIPAQIASLPVVAIGDYAFFNNTTIQSVTFPDSLQTIGESAFSACTSLASADLSGLSSLTEIGNHAFAECALSVPIQIPSSIQTIGISAFIESTSPNTAASISNIEILGGGANLQSIEDSAFGYVLPTDQYDSAAWVTPAEQPTWLQAIIQPAGGGSASGDPYICAMLE